MKLLLVNHTAHVSGGERSLLDLMQGLQARHHSIRLACPEGDLACRSEALGIAVDALPGTDGSLKAHPIETPRAVGQIAAAALRLKSIAREAEPDVVHANSIRGGLVACIAAAAGAPRPLVHIRDVLPEGPLARLTLGVLDRRAAGVVANSSYTAAAVGRSISRPALRSVHNPIDLDRFDAQRYDREQARAALGIGPGETVATVIAQLTPWKGQDVAVRAVALAASQRPELRLLLVGAAKFVSRATRHDNHSYVRGLKSLIGELGAEDRVTFLGEREDIPEILRATDLLVLPSWEEPYGRAVAEAMAMGVCVLATAVGGPRELIEHGEDGLLLPPQQHRPWASEIVRLAAAPDERERIGQAAMRKARSTLGIDVHCAALERIYASVARRA